MRRYDDGSWLHRWLRSEEPDAPGAWLRGFAYGAVIAVVAYAASTTMRRLTLTALGVPASLDRQR
jgi:alpha/beta superfamily hydrolase